LPQRARITLRSVLHCVELRSSGFRNPDKDDHGSRSRTSSGARPV
jgi:hypothetical protein